jgi:hypothetical protein
MCQLHNNIYWCDTTSYMMNEDWHSNKIGGAAVWAVTKDWFLEETYSEKLCF